MNDAPMHYDRKNGFFYPARVRIENQRNLRVKIMQLVENYAANKCGWDDTSDNEYFNSSQGNIFINSVSSFDSLSSELLHQKLSNGKLVEN